MEEKTVFEMGSELGISTDAIRKRIARLDIRPARYIGPTAIYRVDAALLEEIRSHSVRGRPKKEAGGPRAAPLPFRGRVDPGGQIPRVREMPLKDWRGQNGNAEAIKAGHSKSEKRHIPVTFPPELRETLGISDTSFHTEEARQYILICTQREFPKNQTHGLAIVDRKMNLVFQYRISGDLSKPRGREWVIRVDITGQYINLIGKELYWEILEDG